MAVPYVCPCCQARLGEARPSGAFSGKIRRILELLEKSPAGVTVDQIVDELYGFDPNGGPDNAANVIRVRFAQARDRLARFGWRIEGRGYAPKRYFLVPVEPAA